MNCMKKYKINAYEENILNIEKAVENTGVSNIGAIVCLKENVDYDAFCNSTKIILAENPSMRKYIGSNYSICYTIDTDYIVEKMKFNNIDEMYMWANSEIKIPFDLNSHRLFSIKYISVNESRYIFFKVHHIVCDGMALVNLCHKYEEALEKDESYLPVFTEPKEEEISEEKYKNAVEFFDKYVSEDFVFYTDENSLDYSGDYEKKVLEIGLSKKIKAFSAENRISAVSVFLCGIFKYFSYVKNRDTITLGNVLLNRDFYNLYDISMRANTLPLVIKYNDNSFAENCKSINETLLNLMEYSFYTQRDIYENQHIHNNLYDISVSYRNEKLMPKLKNGSIKQLFNGCCDSNMRFFINEISQGFEIEIQYKKSLYKSQYIILLLERIMKIIGQGIDNTEFNSIDVFSLEDTDVYKKLNNNFFELNNKNINELFFETAEKYADEKAVEDSEISFTFKEFYNYSGGTAEYIKHKGACKGDVIGVQLKRNAFLPVVIMGILRAGCVYMPVDIETGNERLEYLRKQCRFIITDNHIENIRQNTNTDLEYGSEAYLMFTSGSSGEPKGVKISSQAIYNRMYWMNRKYNLARRILQKTTNVFDVSMWELLSPVFGGRLYMLENGYEKYPDKIIEAVLKYKIQILHFVPSMLRVFLDYCLKNNIYAHCVEDIFVSGERLTQGTIKGFKAVFTNAQLHNLYGPTECAVDVTYYDVNFNESNIPIGKPVYNTQIYIMNGGKVLPLYEKGEICISGIQVGKYIGENQGGFRTVKGKKVYFTGDRGFIGNDGNIYFSGRIDRQSKIRGMRVEPESVEKALLGIDGINDARAFVHNGRLWAVYTGSGENIRQKLSEKLSTGEMPSLIKNIEHIPLNKNGKTDYKALVILLEKKSKINEKVSPQEKYFIDVVSNEGDIKIPSVNEDLFEMGLDSLGVIRSVNALSHTGVKFSDFYEFRTIREIIYHINSKKYITSLKKCGSKRALVCVPYGGAEPQVFLDMCKNIDNTDVLGVYVSSFDKNASAEEIGSVVARELVKGDYSEFALYGHCVGSAVALEIAYSLEKLNKNVRAVFIGASLPMKTPSVLGNVISHWNFMNGRMIEKILEKYGGEKVLFDKNTERQFKEDAQRFFKYMNTDKKIYLKASITLLFGDNDKMTQNYEIKARNWERYIPSFSVETVKKGSHYFIKNQGKQTAKILMRNWK